MSKHTFTLLLTALIFQANSNAQSHCLQPGTYETVFVSDGKVESKTNLPMFFYFTEDSLIISFDKLAVNKLDAFRIISKNCEWNSSFTQGRSEFDLMLFNPTGSKFPKLVLSIDEKKLIRIALIHENGQKRVFTN